MTFPFIDPDEMQRQHDAAIMHAAEQRHRWLRLLTEMSPEDLATLMEMLRFCNDNKKGIPYFIGMSSAIQQLQNNRCVCGNDHDADMLTDAAQKLQTERDEENAKATMIEYGLQRAEDGKLYCTGCGMEYQSLDDRMLKPPGVSGCSGCQQKSAWG